MSTQPQNEAPTQKPTCSTCKYWERAERRNQATDKREPHHNGYCNLFSREGEDPSPE